MAFKKISLISFLLALCLASLYIFSPSNPADKLMLDAYFRLRGQQAEQNDILIVSLDARFLEAYPYRIGELDRRFYARVVEQLLTAGALAVGLDIFFPEQSSDVQADLALAEALLNDRVVLPFVRSAPSRQDASTLSSEDHLVFHPLLQDAQRGVLELQESAHFFRPQIRFSDATLPSFSLAILEAAGLRSQRNLNQPVLIDYRGPKTSFPSLSFLDIYRNQFAYSDVQGKLVLLGVTLEGTDRDQILTAFGEMPGVEVNANQLYSLLHSRLSPLNAFVMAALIIAASLLAPFLSHKKRGLIYTLAACIASFTITFLLFLQGLFISPLSFIVIFTVAYINTSYDQLKRLDKDLNHKLMQLLDNTTLSPSSTTNDFSLVQGFAPKGYITDAPDMLESLTRGLSAEAGLLFYASERVTKGIVSDALLAIADQAFEQRVSLTKGTKPHFLAEPLQLANETVGVLALSLPAPPPPHLQALIKTSVHTFSQLARYQQLRTQANTLATTVWPQNSQSSEAKLAALSMISDLVAAERGWLGALLESLPQAVFIMSPYGYSIYKNAAARRLLGDEKNMLKTISDSLAIEAETFQKEYVNMVEQGQSLELGLTERKHERPVLLNLQVVRSGSEVRGVAGTVSDLSKLSELDQKRQDMIAMVVHDLRSPLTSIQGFADLLLSGSTKDAQEHLGIISTEAARMRRMTDAFLDISKLESESFELDLVASNIADLLRYAVASVSAQASHKQTVIQVDAPSFLEAKVDADLISRLMSNLLTNAIKYSPSKSKVVLSLSQTADSLLFSVKDNGYGMSEEQQAQLFQKYKRGDTKAVGTGLGLYLVRLIVEAHKGHISVESSLNEGSEFKLSLPL